MQGTENGLRLDASKLRRVADPSLLGFETTAEVEPIDVTIGQPRALDAIEFGIENAADRFNLFVSGPPGVGKEDTVLAMAGDQAAQRPVPPDWVYVFNFENPDRPTPISMPAGRARSFARAMERFVETVESQAPANLESDEVQERRNAAAAKIAEERNTLISNLQEFGSERDVRVLIEPGRIQTVPMESGEPLSKEAFDDLPESKQREIEVRISEVNAEIASTMRQIQRLDRDMHESVQKVDREVMAAMGEMLIDGLLEEFDDCDECGEFLKRVRADLPDHVLHVLRAGEVSSAKPGEVTPAPRPDFTRYVVNVFVDNGDLEGAPVVLERNPTLSNLVGRIEFRPLFGTLVSDFRHISNGAIQRANGGFLVLHVEEVLRNPRAWECLKRVLMSGEVEIESPDDQISTMHIARLRPLPIPVDLKVILIGPRVLYELAHRSDTAFRELFRVRADFDTHVPWTLEHAREYASFISRQVIDRELTHFDASAVARVVEFGARSGGHAEKLTTTFRDVSNLVVEASYWADKEGDNPVSASHVEKAIEKRAYRAGLLEEQMQDLIEEQTIRIATEGSEVGQVNGLAVLDTGDHAFGKPSRITARVSVGKGLVQSIDRETELSGPIHSKGFLTLAGYLRGQYGDRGPLSLSATITFEQAYQAIEGDSASSAELYALLSALSGLPIDQGKAVTGSVDQVGRVQSIGGANHKIEGFFDVCESRGLTGDQGVLIPATNVQNLMLEQRVIDAVQEGRFHVWAIDSIDQGIELLTGTVAGAKDDDGAFPAETVHGRVAARLETFLEKSGAAAPGES